MKITALRKRQGFTLIELLVVLAILGGLMAVLFVSLGENKNKATKGLAKTQMNTDYANIALALDEFRAAVGRLPTTEEGLEALVRNPAGLPGWNGPYLKKVPVDPYGTPYRYIYEGGTKYKIISLGADGREGGEKDDADIDLSTVNER
jgi:general secretion pathway protein G